jgi:hypothetical protein
VLRRDHPGSASGLYVAVDAAAPAEARERLDAGWQWFGVDEEGRLLLGRRAWMERPRAVTITEGGGDGGRHGIRVDRPLRPPLTHWLPTERRAREEFLRLTEKLRGIHGGAPFALVTRIEGGVVVEEVLVDP